MAVNLRELAKEHTKRSYLENRNYINEGKPLRDNNLHYAELVHGIPGELAKEEEERRKEAEELGITQQMIDDAQELIDMDEKRIEREENAIKVKKEQLRQDKRELTEMKKEFNKPPTQAQINKFKSERLGLTLEELKRIRQNPVNVPEHLKEVFKELYSSHDLNGREYVWSLIKKELDKFQREKKKKEKQEKKDHKEKLKQQQQEANNKSEDE